MTQVPGDDPERTVDEPTVSLGDDSPTTTGPTAGAWALDELMTEVPPGPLVWGAAPHPAFDNAGLRETRSVGYYVTLTLAVVLAVGAVALLAVLSVNPPVRTVAGSPQGPNIPELPGPSSSESTTPSTSSSVPSSTPADPLAELAEHPLSTSTAPMARLTCSLPRFDPADGKQAAFYRAAKVCADAGFGGLLRAAGLPAASVPVVTVHGGPADSPCGTVKPTGPAMQCHGTVYMTPARLRDVEKLGRYPGKYLGVFLREYAKAVQYATGLTSLAEPTGGDGATRLEQQATCLAGIASGAMAGLGAVDGNITNEIRQRLSSVDAPPEATTWLMKGFQHRQPAACNTWS